MREQTAPEHPGEAHERAALARGAFVTLTATDDLAIQAKDCIQERENSCVLMVPCFGEHIHQLLSLRCGQLHRIIILRHSKMLGQRTTKIKMAKKTRAATHVRF
jgi:hypothetical protein